MVRRDSACLIALVALLAVLVRVPLARWPLISDEGGYAYTAQWWFRGLTLYSDQLWFDRPQGIFLAYKLGMALFGPETWAIRLWGALWAAGTSVLVALIAGRLYGQRAAWVGGILHAVFSALPQIEGFTANAEVFAALPATASAYCLLIGCPTLAGLLASLALLLKPSGGSIALLRLGWLLFQERKQWRRQCWRRQYWRCLVCYALGALPLCLAALLHGSVTVGLPAYWHAVAGFRLGLRDGSPLAGLLRHGRQTAPAWLPLVALGVAGWRQGERGRLAPERVFVAVWLASALAGMALGGHWYPHYFIQAMPPLAVLAAGGLVRVWGDGRPVARLAAALMLAAPLLLLAPYLRLSPAEGNWLLYRRPGYRIAAEVARYLQDHTRPDESVYVAFAESDIYYLADRRSAFPYLYRLEVQHMPGAYEALLQTIAEQKPTYVLALDRPPENVDPDGRFQQALRAGYELETIFEGVPLYRRRAR
jgi:4-amino-4-deoxy-L-arabinose transferase-like glycosyltransferase